MTAVAGEATEAGLQAERTVLSWRRTLPATALCTAVLGRAAVIAPDPAALSAAVCGAAALAVTLAGSWTRGRRCRANTVDPRCLGQLVPLALCVAIAAASVAALAALIQT